MRIRQNFQQDLDTIFSKFYILQAFLFYIISNFIILIFYIQFPIHISIFQNPVGILSEAI